MCRIISFGNVRMSGMSRRLVSSYAAMGVGLAVVVTFGLAAISSVVEQPSQDQFMASQPELDMPSAVPAELPAPPSEPKEVVTPPAKTPPPLGMALPTAEIATATVDQVPGAANVNNTEFFVPAELTITVGTTVIWTNSDTASHTIVSGDVNDPDTWGKVFDSGVNKPGDTFELTFDTPGEYPYLCQTHPWMVGKIIVK